MSCAELINRSEAILQKYARNWVVLPLFITLIIVLNETFYGTFRFPGMRGGLVTRSKSGRSRATLLWMNTCQQWIGYKI